MKWILGLLTICTSFSLVAEEKILPVAVIGSGPAGLSAALITSRDRVETHVFLGKCPGGPLNATTCLGNWPGSIKGKGKDTMERIFSQVRRFNVALHKEEIVRVDFSKRPFHLYTNEGTEYLATSVIVASGAKPRHLQIDGEEQYWDKGIETSIYKTDANRFEGKTVAVVGGGIDAAKKATILAKTANKVYLFVRGDSMQRPFMKKRIKNKGKGKIEVHYHTRVIQVLGDLERVRALDIVSPGGMDRVPVDALILAAGIEPNTDLFKGQIECDERGFILLDGRTQKTSVEGVFAAGNATDPRYRQGAISAGDGMKAGYDALSFLYQLGLIHLE